jgi:outer membrane murein-binding lipoprotein Lpp
MKKIALLLAVLTLTLCLASCGLIGGEKTFTVDDLSITVKGLFSEQNQLNEDYNLVLISTKAGVMILKETFAEFEDAGLDTDMSVKEYAKIVMQGNSLTGTPTEEDGLTYFTYTAETDGTEFTYVGYCFRGDDAYWMVQMYCATSDFESMKADFTAWAKSVTFA